MGQGFSSTRKGAVLKVYYVGDELPVLDDQDLYLKNSIFLAGPTPRSEDVPTWRKEALRLLKESGFAGSVFVPETAVWGWLGDYDGQVEWEWKALGLSNSTLFWVPRDLKDMPAFTTNVEFGFMVALRPDMVVLGSPEGAPKLRYLHSLANQIDRFHRFLGYDDEDLDPIPVVDSLEAALTRAMSVASSDE